MQKQTAKNRKSQGRKRSSGGSLTGKKGSPDRNENTKNDVKDEKPKKLIAPAKAIII